MDDKKYCINCGAPLKENNAFCTKCGNRVINENVNQVITDTNPPAKPSNKTLITVLVAVIVILCIAIIAVFSRSAAKSNPAKHNNDTSLNTENSLSTETPDPTSIPTDETMVEPTVKPTSAPTGNKTYTNARYGFSFTYPTDIFYSITDSDNGDGIVLHGDDIVVSVYGSNNITGVSLNEIYDNMVSIVYPDATYHTCSSDFYVISGIDNSGTIYYIKEYIGSGCLNTMYIEYPESKKALFDDTVTSLSKTFKSGSLNYAH